MARLSPVSAKEFLMLRNGTISIVLAAAIALGVAGLSTGALARGGGFGGSHFGGFGHFGGGYHAGHMSGHFGGFHAGHAHGERHGGFGGYGYSPYDCDYPYGVQYGDCY